MQWTHPEIDLTGTIHDLKLLPLPARILGVAATHITDSGLRALLVTSILSGQPHRIGSAPYPPGSGYHHLGGRALRAAVVVRALELMGGSVDRATYEQILAATLLSHLAFPRETADASVQHSWLEHVAADQSDHLAIWGHSLARARAICYLATTASDPNPDLPDPWAPTALPHRRLVAASRAAEQARHPELQSSTAPEMPLLPAWMDPDLPHLLAARLYREDTYMHLTRRPASGPALRVLSPVEGSVLSQ